MAVITTAMPRHAPAGGGPVEQSCRLTRSEGSKAVPTVTSSPMEANREAMPDSGTGTRYLDESPTSGGQLPRSGNDSVEDGTNDHSTRGRPPGQDTRVPEITSAATAARIPMS
jgi:hypothetical protein